MITIRIQEHEAPYLDEVQFALDLQHIALGRPHWSSPTITSRSIARRPLIHSIHSPITHLRLDIIRHIRILRSLSIRRRRHRYGAGWCRFPSPQSLQFYARNGSAMRIVEICAGGPRCVLASPCEPQQGWYPDEEEENDDAD